jgi:hypothetical protein
MERELMFARKLGDESFLFVGLGASEFVVEMNDGEDDAQLGAEFQQETKQRHGICSAGDGEPDAVAGLQQLERADMVEELLREVMHRDMVQLRP